MSELVTLLFDVTRMVSRRNAPTPTGIDRVDLRYALHMRARFGGDCLCICQVQGRLTPVPEPVARNLLATLDEQWAGRVPPSLELDAEIREAGLLPPPPPPPPPSAAEGNAVRAAETIPADHINYLFNRSYQERMRFVLDTDIRKYLPKGLHWFFGLPRPLRWLLLAPVMTSADRFQRAARFGATLAARLRRKPAAAQAAAASGDTAVPTSLDPALVRELQRRGDSRVLYLNMSHHGLDNRAAFSELYTTWRAQFIIFIHDIIPIEYPEYVRPGDDAKHGARLALVAALQPFLIFNSEDTRQRVFRYLDGLGFRDLRSTVSYVGVEPHLLLPVEPRSRLRTGVPGPYFITVGTVEGRKNHLVLLQVWRELAETAAADGRPVPKLVIVGRRGWENEAAVAMLDRCAGLRGHVIEMSGIDDRRLAALISGARALLFPSFSEGWGMPLVEALARGVPTICSDIPVFREAGQMVPDYVHPLDGPGWQRLIAAYTAETSPERDAQLERIKSYVVPTWPASLARLDSELDAAFDWLRPAERRLSA